MMRIDEKGHVYRKCEICGKDIRFGPHLYEAHRLELYGNVFCCHDCWENNWDGWSPNAEPTILRILKEKNLQIPERNKKGWLPRD
ncbi:hypothetical protein [Escherichia coli]|uniref:hypothetical protein n=1 Tax=Escherichia coli TaxID=562 RepID=UPI00111C1F4E|nr:hypothetical protein [Escherichia coli]